MSAGLVMLAILAWVLMSAAVAGLIMFLSETHQTSEELRDRSHGSDDSDDYGEQG